LKKLLFVLPNLERGGYQRVFITFMRTLDYKKYEINLLVTGKAEGMREILPGYVNIYELKSRKTFFSLGKTIKFIRYLKPDLVISTSYMVNTVMLLAKLLLKRSERPEMWMREPNTPGRSIHFLHRFFLKKFYKYADCVIAQTPCMKQQITRFYKLSPDKVKVLYNPIDKDLIKNSVEEFDNPFDPGYINLLAIGRLAKQKGFDWLLEGLHKLVQHSNKYRLHIIGEGPWKDNLKSLIDKYELNSVVSLQGEKDNPFVYLKYADLLISPSRWEGFSNVIPESIFLGTPVVVSETSSYLHDIIKSPVNGSVIPVGDIDQLVRSIQNVEKYRIDKELIKNHEGDSRWIEKIRK